MKDLVCQAKENALNLVSDRVARECKQRFVIWSINGSDAIRKITSVELCKM